jgi:hydrogenase-4 component B
MSPTVALTAAIGLCLLGALASVVLPHARAVIIVACVCAGLAALATLAAGLAVVLGAPPPEMVLASPLPLGPLVVRPDALSGFFLIVIGLVAAPVALYSVGYLGGFIGLPGGHPDLRLFGALLNLLLLSLILIVAAADAVLFLMAWEAMAWLSYLLVAYEHEDRHVTRAAYQMIAVSEIGTVGIVTAFLLLAGPTGALDFAALRAGASALPPAVRDVVFFTALFGFGAKAGLLPLQLWLPEAHPAAPSNVSSLLSAVIVKLGVYGIARVGLDLLGVGPGWWGLVVLGLGAVTALVGILYALLQADLKRVLAYSTIENIGIILVGLGAALLFRGWALPALAAIAALAALYHVVNHAAYKGLLFLAAGAVDRAAGTRELDRLGGLVRRMPWTTALFLLGALAIAGVPPLNGYVSEWMTLEVLLRTDAVPSTGARIAVVIAGALLALTAGLAVTAFVRAFGVAFVGLPRSDDAAAAREVGPSKRLGMAGLAAVCVGLGVLPTFVLTALDRVTAPLVGTSVVNQVVPPLFTDQPGDYAPLVGLGGALFRGLPVNGLVVIAAPTLNTITAPSYLVLAEALFLALLLGALRLLHPLGRRRTGPVWAGGIPAFTPRMQYSALAYANPLRLIFQVLYRSGHRFEAPSPAARHLAGRIAYAQEVPEPFEREVYRPLARLVDDLSSRAAGIQSGSVNQYVAYIFAIVLVVLVLRLL